MLAALHLPWLSHFCRSLGLVGLLALLGGCAQTPAAHTAQELLQRNQWTGRMALQVEGQPSRSFIAAFELQGNAHTGTLELTGPLGNILAQLRWTPEQAELDTGTSTEQAPSVDALLERGTGAAIPVAALFDWLSGQHTALDGWSTDLSAIAQGRLNATRFSPEPATTLRITFER